MDTTRPGPGAAQRRGEQQGAMPPSPLRDAFELLHVHLLFNEAEGISVGSALASIEEKVGIRPRPALDEAVRMGLVEGHTDFLGRSMVRRGPRSAELLRRVYGGEAPPTRESLLAEANAWLRYLDARDARLAALREAARPREHNTASSLPAWMP